MANQLAVGTSFKNSITNGVLTELPNNVQKLK